MKKRNQFFGVLNLLLLSITSALLAGGNLADKGLLKFIDILALIILSFSFIKLNIKPSRVDNPNKRLKAMYNGRELMIIFSWGFVFHIVLGLLWKTLFDLSITGIIVYSSVAVISLALVVFNGLIRIVSTSKQLGIVLRALIILLWWMPILNIYMIAKACRIVRDEYELETEKNELDNVRKENEICSTKYPLLMVHGVFFRDMRFFNYWGRVPKELIRNGATVFYGEQHSAGSVESCAYELKNKIEEVVRQTGCEKVNIIAHSKGGLDSRYAITHLGMDKYVATLTTINTPHRGCEYADFILEHAPSGFKNFLANKYNSAVKKFGDTNPDFIAAVADLTAKNCKARNETTPDMDSVYYQSVGARMKNSRSAGFPLNLSYGLVKFFSKTDNDGLVDVESMKWGSRHKFFEPQTGRGISHGDMIDLFREDIKGFDIREEYVSIVKELKEMGY